MPFLWVVWQIALSLNHTCASLCFIHLHSASPHLVGRDTMIHQCSLCVAATECESHCPGSARCNFGDAASHAVPVSCHLAARGLRAQIWQSKPLAYPQPYPLCSTWTYWSVFLASKVHGRKTKVFSLQSMMSNWRQHVPRIKWNDNRNRNIDEILSLMFLCVQLICSFRRLFSQSSYIFVSYLLVTYG